MLTGRRMFLYFAAFFGLIFCMNAVMITLATRSHRGVVTEHAYAKGLAYNQVVEADKAQQALGLRADISLENQLLSARLYNATGEEITPATMKAVLVRPTQEGMDVAITLHRGEAPLSLPAAGLWQVRVYAQHQGQAVQFSQRLVVAAHDAPR